MKDYDFINGLQGLLLDAETRRFFALEKLKLTVQLHREQAAKDKEEAVRKQRTKELTEEWGLDPLYLDFLSDETIKVLHYKLSNK